MKKSDGKFKMSLQQEGHIIHINLMGDFDGSSACQLSNVLSEQVKGVDKVIVHTDNLKNVCLFGRKVLEGNLSHLKRGCPITFEGRQADLF